MAFLSSLNIPLSGMTAERFRLDIIAQNINNADNVASTPEEAYKRQMVVFGEDKTFKKLLFAKLNSGEIASYNYVKYRGVEAKAVVDDPTPAEPVYDPTHPLADERGYIYESNVGRGYRAARRDGSGEHVFREYGGVRSGKVHGFEGADPRQGLIFERKI